MKKQKWLQRSQVLFVRPGMVMGQEKKLLFVVLLLVSFCPLSVFAVGPYTVSGYSVVDQGTGLQWQKSDDATLRTWENALAYCENLSLDSKTDWRLPNIREMKSVVDDSHYHPSIDPAFTCQSAYYWTATTVTRFPTRHAWSVFFANGDDNCGDKKNIHFVRCVRAGVYVSQP